MKMVGPGGRRISTNGGVPTTPTHRILWLRPTRGENISVRRQRIANHLEDKEFLVDIQNASGLDALNAIELAVTGDYDAILGNVRMGLYVAFPVARALDVPFAGTVSDPITDIDSLPRPLFEILRRYEWFALGQADACTFTYQSTYEEAKRRGIDGRKLPNAVDYDQFADPDSGAVERAREVLDQAGVDTSKPIVIYVGGLTEETYHISDILGAAEETPGWEFVFIGEGEAEEAVAAAADRQENIFYPGSFEYALMPGFMSHATAGFCFKDAEQPLKVMEYGAAGVVTIAQPGELRLRLDDDEAVFIDPVPSEIARTLTELAADEKRRETLTENLRQRARQESWRAVADEFYAFLNEITSENQE
jgi:glycosyltransferase involved in cell wall biosynthesis